MPMRSIDGRDIHYVEAGEGSQLVLLHAFPVDARMWEGQIAGLSVDYRVVAIDYPGFGQSAPAEQFTVPRLAETVHAFVRQGLGVTEPFVLGGLSIGGYVAMNFARQFPNALRGLILADTRDAADTAEQREGRDKMIETARAQGASAIADAMLPKLLARGAESKRPATFKAVRSMIEACSIDSIVAALIALRDRPDMTDFLPTLQTPTLFIVGEHDSVTPPSLAEQMHARVPGSSLAVIRGAGHLSAMEQPAQVNAAIDIFLRSVK